LEEARVRSIFLRFNFTGTLSDRHKRIFAAHIGDPDLNMFACLGDSALSYGLAKHCMMVHATHSLYGEIKAMAFSNETQTKVAQELGILQLFKSSSVSTHASGTKLEAFLGVMIDLGLSPYVLYLEYSRILEELKIDVSLVNAQYVEVNRQYALDFFSRNEDQAKPARSFRAYLAEQGINVSVKGINRILNNWEEQSLLIKVRRINNEPWFYLNKAVVPESTPSSPVIGIPIKPSKEVPVKEVYVPKGEEVDFGRIDDIEELWAKRFLG